MYLYQLLMLNEINKIKFSAHLLFLFNKLKKLLYIKDSI